MPTEIAGMDIRDFSNKCGGSIFRVDDNIFFMDGLDRGDPDIEDYPEESSYPEGSFIGSILTKGVRGEEWTIKRYSVDDLLRANIDLSYPQVGYVNYKKGAVYVQRNVERQWKVGFNGRTVSFLDRFSKERKLAGIPIIYSNLHTNGEFIRRLFNRFYYSPERAISMVRNGERIGAAISRHIYIGQSLNFPHLLVCYKNIPIGYIDSSNRKFIFKEAAYVEKILPFNVVVVEDIANVAVIGD